MRVGNHMGVEDGFHNIYIHGTEISQTGARKCVNFTLSKTSSKLYHMHLLKVTCYSILVFQVFHVILLDFLNTKLQPFHSFEFGIDQSGLEEMIVQKIALIVVINIFSPTHKPGHSMIIYNSSHLCPSTGQGGGVALSLRLRVSCSGVTQYLNIPTLGC